MFRNKDNRKLNHELKSSLDDGTNIVNTAKSVLCDYVVYPYLMHVQDEKYPQLMYKSVFVQQGSAKVRDIPFFLVLFLLYRMIEGH